MTPTDPDDVHAPYVDDLAAAGDWAGLVRYWMAHQHGPALDRAIDLVHGRAAAARARGDWPGLAALLADVRRDPLDPERQLALELMPAFSQAEQATLLLLWLYPRVALCELAAQAGGVGELPGVG